MAAGWQLGLEICNPFKVSSTQYFPIILNPEGGLKVAQKDIWSSGLTRCLRRLLTRWGLLAEEPSSAFVRIRGQECPLHTGKSRRMKFVRRYMVLATFSGY